MTAFKTLRPPRRSKSSHGVAPVIGLAPLAVLLIIWQIIGSPHSTFFPRPSLWFKAILSVEQNGNLWSSLGATALTFIEAIIVATIIGVALGVAIGSIRRIDTLLDPLLDFLRNLPAAALVPAAAIIFGTNTKMALIIVVFSCVWPILLNTRAQVQEIHPTLSSIIDNLGIRGIRKQGILVGSALPAILLGVRVAAPLALIVTLLTEFITNIPGLGALLLSAQQNFDSPEVYGLLVISGILALLINSLVTFIELPIVRRHGVQS